MLTQRRDRQMIVEPVEMLFEELALALLQPAALFQAARALEQSQPATGLGAAHSGLKANEHGSLHFNSKREWPDEGLTRECPLRDQGAGGRPLDCSRPIGRIPPVLADTMPVMDSNPSGQFFKRIDEVVARGFRCSTAELQPPCCEG